MLRLSHPALLASCGVSVNGVRLSQYTLTEAGKQMLSFLLELLLNLPFAIVHYRERKRRRERERRENQCEPTHPAETSK